VERTEHVPEYKLRAVHFSGIDIFLNRRSNIKLLPVAHAVNWKSSKKDRQTTKTTTIRISSTPNIWGKAR
jgi:hypothetical protein